MSTRLQQILRNIDQTRSRLSASEMAVRQAAILPILDWLGWDTSNIREVIPEYDVGKRARVDYCLALDGENKVLIEVKNTSEDLDRHQEQLLKYAFRVGVELAVLSNGITWWFYLALLKGDWERRKFFTIDVDRQDMELVKPRFIQFLSRDAVASGKAVEDSKELYAGKLRQDTVKKALPSAWEKIMEGPDEFFVDLLTETVEGICGHRPSEEVIVDYISSMSALMKAGFEKSTAQKRAIPAISREKTPRRKKEKKGVPVSTDQIEASVPKAFLAWGGLSIGAANIVFFPISTSEKKIEFVINFFGSGETKAWTSQNRVKIPKKNWRVIVDQLDIQPDDRFVLRVKEPLEYYEALKQDL